MSTSLGFMLCSILGSISIIILGCAISFIRKILNIHSQRMDAMSTRLTLVENRVDVRPPGDMSMVDYIAYMESQGFSYTHDPNNPMTPVFTKKEEQE